MHSLNYSAGKHDNFMPVARVARKTCPPPKLGKIPPLATGLNFAAFVVKIGEFQLPARGVVLSCMPLKSPVARTTSNVTHAPMRA